MTRIRDMIQATSCSSCLLMFFRKSGWKSWSFKKSQKDPRKSWKILSKNLSSKVPQKKVGGKVGTWWKVGGSTLPRITLQTVFLWKSCCLWESSSRPLANCLRTGATAKGCLKFASCFARNKTNKLRYIYTHNHYTLQQEKNIKKHFLEEWRQHVGFWKKWKGN